MIRLIFSALFLLIYFIASLPVQLAEYILQQFNMDLRNKSSLAFVKFGLRGLCFISGCKINVNGFENIPEDQAVLFVSNHQSLFDIITTYPLMKRPTGYVAKKEIRKFPCLSWWMYFVNCIFLDREDPRKGLKSIIHASDMVKSGVSMFIFPEGTRSKDGRIHEFKEGSLKIATKSKSPVIPVGISGTYDIFERQFPKIKPANVTISFGKPIYTSELSRDELKGLTDIVRKEVSRLADRSCKK